MGGEGAQRDNQICHGLGMQSTSYGTVGEFGGKWDNDRKLIQHYWGTMGEFGGLQLIRRIWKITVVWVAGVSALSAGRSLQSFVSSSVSLMLLLHIVAIAAAGLINR